MAILKTLTCAAALALAGAAQAHVTADPGEATLGSYQAVRFRVGHGCNDRAATTALRIEIPDAVPSARPQPKAGWTLAIERAADDPSKVTAITWRGVLPPDQFDEFAVMLHLPATAGTLYFPAVQTCGDQETQWTEFPDAGETAHMLSRPAPALRLIPAAAPAEGHHH